MPHYCPAFRRCFPLLFFFCLLWPVSLPAGDIIEYDYRVIRTYPHDPDAWTQGLVYTDGNLYESTGQYARSSVRRVELTTGRVLDIYGLPFHLYGEGLAATGDRLVQLTWRNHVGLVYNRSTLSPVEEFEYPTEGWGLAWDGTRLILSDGTPTLYFLSPEDFSVIGKVTVTEDGMPLARLNELEYIDGRVYANVWLTDRIVIIDPETGRVTGRAYLSGLLTEAEREKADVLNGIAYDRCGDRLLVTGKLWPKLFEIELLPRSGETAGTQSAREVPVKKP